MLCSDENPRASLISEDVGALDKPVIRAEKCLAGVLAGYLGRLTVARSDHYCEIIRDGRLRSFTNKTSDSR